MMNPIADTFPTLPQLFDLMDSPSYNPVKKPAHKPKRPSTTTVQNYMTTSTPKTTAKRRSKASHAVATTTAETFIKTDSTFYSPTTMNNSFQFEPYCFSELRTIQRPLKKLYSSRQYENFSKKLGDMKERYASLYGEAEPRKEEISPEKFQELYLNAEKMFNASYSIKYMGLKNDQLGIVSQRVPMQPTQDQPQVTAKSLRQAIRTSQAPQKRPVTQQVRRTPNSSVPPQNPTTGFMRQSSSKGSLTGWKNNESYALAVRRGSEKIDQGYQGHQTKGESLLMGRSFMNSTYSPKIDKFMSPTSNNTRNKTFSEMSMSKDMELTGRRTGQTDDVIPEYSPDIDEMVNQTPDRTLHYDHDIREVNTTGVFDTLRQSKNSNSLRESSPHVVTSYFLPKKLQAVRKKISDISQAASMTMGRWHVAKNSKEKVVTEGDMNNTTTTAANKEVSWVVEDPEQRKKIWQKVSVADQRKENTADFTRKVRSMGKVKNSILRNVRMEQAWMAKGVKDDLDVLEKYRTHELKNVMANSTKYSYAKLLKTMKTKERPETALIENTQKREKILATREEKRRLLQQPQVDGSLEIDTKDYGNNYVVKIQYPKENKMLNRFIKIRENVEA